MSYDNDFTDINNQLVPFLFKRTSPMIKTDYETGEGFEIFSYKDPKGNFFNLLSNNLSHLDLIEELTEFIVVYITPREIEYAAAQSKRKQPESKRIKFFLDHFERINTLNPEDIRIDILRDVYLELSINSRADAHNFMELYRNKLAQQQDKSEEEIEYKLFAPVSREEVSKEEKVMETPKSQEEKNREGWRRGAQKREEQRQAIKTRLTELEETLKAALEKNAVLEDRIKNSLSNIDIDRMISEQNNEMTRLNNELKRLMMENSTLRQEINKWSKIFNGEDEDFEVSVIRKVNKPNDKKQR